MEFSLLLNPNDWVSFIKPSLVFILITMFIISSVISSFHNDDFVDTMIGTLAMTVGSMIFIMLLPIMIHLFLGGFTLFIVFHFISYIKEYYDL